MIESTDDTLPDIIYLLQRLKNALVSDIIAEEAAEELPRVLAWFDRAIVLVTEKYTGKFSRERQLSKPYETIFWKARDGMYISTVEGNFVHGNQALVNMLGFENLEEMLEMDIRKDLYINGEEREKMLQALETDGFCDHVEFDFRTAGGDGLPDR